MKIWEENDMLRKMFKWTLLVDPDPRRSILPFDCPFSLPHIGCFASKGPMPVTLFGGLPLGSWSCFAHIYRELEYLGGFYSTGVTLAVIYSLLALRRGKL